MSSIEINKNAGDWAELYALLQSLSLGKLLSADGDLNIIKGQYYPIIKIEMQKKETGEPIVYEIDAPNETVKIFLDGKEKSEIPMQDLRSEAKEFFEIISSRKPKDQGKNRAFSVPEIIPCLERLLNPKTKQSSDKKADIHMVIHDTMTGFKNSVGFSVKSKHSNPASLINPSGQTLFQYHISNPNNRHENEIKESLSKIDRENKKVGPKHRIQSLKSLGCSLDFVQVKGKSFSENLQIIDSSMPRILAACLDVFMSSSISSLEEIVKIVAENNPCQYKAEKQERLISFYEYKMKRLIVDSALGMIPKTPWSGQYDASGGYLVVKDSGDVLCYHLYNWNALQDYLYKNLKFDTPSSTNTGKKKSYNYALFYKENDIPCVDICLQLRFK